MLATKVRSILLSTRRNQTQDHLLFIKFQTKGKQLTSIQADQDLGSPSIPQSTPVTGCGWHTLPSTLNSSAQALGCPSPESCHLCHSKRTQQKTDQPWNKMGRSSEKDQWYLLKRCVETQWQTQTHTRRHNGRRRHTRQSMFSSSSLSAQTLNLRFACLPRALIIL